MRNYNSQLGRDFGFGAGWTAPFLTRLEFSDPLIKVRRGDGGADAFWQDDSGWVGAADTRLRLAQNASGYTLIREDGSSQRFDTAGRLVSAQDPSGRTTSYSYNGTGQLTSVVDPFGKTLTVGYTPAGHIDTVTDSAGNVTRYTYTAAVGPAYRSDVMADFPRGYWRLNDTAGAAAALAAGTVGAGAYGGAYTLNQPGPGPGSRAVSFDATGDGEVNLNDAVNFTTALTLELWVKPQATQPDPDGAFLFTKTSHYATSVIDFPIALTYSPTGVFKLLLSAGNDFNHDATLSSPAVSPGQWYHVVAVYRREGRCELWVNGALVASATITFGISHGAHPWKLANPTENSAGTDRAAFSGELSEAALYSYALSGARIQAHYQAMSRARDNLTRVDYPDGSAKLYHYENPDFPYHLTGISYVEPSGVVTRYATYAYGTSGKATSTEHAGGVERFNLQYDTATQTTVTDAANAAEILTFATNLGVKNLVSKVHQVDGKALAQTFDANNNLTCKKDEEGRVTTYTYNSTNQKLSTTEGLVGSCSAPTTTSATRTTTYQYVSATLDAPTLIQSPSVAAGASKSVALTYGDTRFPTLPTAITQSGFTPAGTALARTVSLAYNAAGQIATIDGPRTDASDVTMLAYYACTTGGACGQLQSVTNALGQTTTYDTYDLNGRLTQVTDANGLRTNYGYDARGRITAITETPPVGLARTTSYTYNAAGHVTSVTFPDGVVLTYTYNAAQKLTRVTDNLGNHIDYTYDLKGNRTSARTFDPSGTLVRDIQTAYNLRNRVASINAGGSITEQLHDALGNLARETDPNQVAAASGLSTTHTYDALNRLIQTVNNVSGVTSYGYDAGDRLTQVQAPNSATTQYRYDDLGNLLQESSPDRGTTSYAYDAAGNVLTQTDARGITVTYTYDALNRVTTLDYPGTAEDVFLTYDTGATCTSGLGRVCQVRDASGTTQYAYDAFGNIAQHQKTELGVTYTTGYAYDARDRITSLTYPSGRVVTYGRDALGRIASAQTTVNGINQTLLSARTYRADGLFLTQTYGNGLSETRTYNTKGELTDQFLGSADTRIYAYDPNGNVTSLQSLPQVGSYAYDVLDRLIQDQITSMPASSRGFTYDANGNRTSDNNGTYVYAAATNRLTQTPSATLTLRCGREHAKRRDLCLQLQPGRAPEPGPERRQSPCYLHLQPPAPAHAQGHRRHHHRLSL